MLHMPCRYVVLYIYIYLATSIPIQVLPFKEKMVLAAQSAAMSGCRDAQVSQRTIMSASQRGSSGDRIGGLSRPVAAYLLPDILAQTGTVECEAVDEVEWNCYPFYQEIEIVLEVTPARKAQIVANFAHLRGAIDAW